MFAFTSAQGQTPGTLNAALEQRIEDLQGDIEFIGEGEGLIEPLNELGGAYMALGQYEKAAGEYQRALKLSEKVHGKQSSDVATSLNNLALVLANQGKYAEAEAM